MLSTKAEGAAYCIIQYYNSTTSLPKTANFVPNPARSVCHHSTGTLGTQLAHAWRQGRGTWYTHSRTRCGVAPVECRKVDRIVGQSDDCGRHSEGIAQI